MDSSHKTLSSLEEFVASFGDCFIFRRGIGERDVSAPGTIPQQV